MYSDVDSDPDDRNFRPTNIARPRPATGKTPAPTVKSVRGSPFLSPAPEPDQRTTRSQQSNISLAPRNFFKRKTPLPPQHGPISFKRPRSGNPLEFFRRKGHDRDVTSEEGSSGELDDLERLGIYVRPVGSGPASTLSVLSSFPTNESLAGVAGKSITRKQVRLSAFSWVSQSRSDLLRSPSTVAIIPQSCSKPIWPEFSQIYSTEERFGRKPASSSGLAR